MSLERAPANSSGADPALRVCTPLPSHRGGFLPLGAFFFWRLLPEHLTHREPGSSPFLHQLSQQREDQSGHGYACASRGSGVLVLPVQDASLLREVDHPRVLIDVHDGDKHFEDIVLVVQEWFEGSTKVDLCCFLRLFELFPYGANPVVLTHCPRTLHAGLEGRQERYNERGEVHYRLLPGWQMDIKIICPQFSQEARLLCDSFGDTSHLVERQQ